MKQACILYIISGITDFVLCQLYLILFKYVVKLLYLFIICLYKIIKYDGYLARKYNWSSKLGSVIDPLADKTLMIISTVSLSISKLIPSKY